MPDRHVGIGREDFLCLVRHLVFDDVGLVLDHFATGTGGQTHHVLGNVQRTAMVDADFGDHQRRIGWPDLASCNIHVRSFSPAR